MATSFTTTDQAQRPTAIAMARARQRRRDWPGLRVAAVAAALHAVFIGWLVLDWRHPTPLPALEALQVRLVPTLPPTPTAPPLALAPAPRLPDPVPPAEARVEHAAAEAPPAPEVAAPPAPPMPHMAEPKLAPALLHLPREPEPGQRVASLFRPTPKPPARRRVQSVPVRSDRPAIGAQDPVVDALGAGDALYRVAVETSGRIGAVTLLRSSGSPAIDQAGETKIRTTMNFPRRADALEATTFFSVTLHFTPEQ